MQALRFPLVRRMALVVALAATRPAVAQAPAGAVLTVRIDDTRPQQTISHFGASDAWTCQFVGTWPAAKKEAIADLLFSTDNGPGGQPRGIGLSLWRVNLGAGSARQGEQSGIKDEWRRAESFLNADGSYDWSRQAGQQWFMQAARRRGVRQFLGFTNSPPVDFTANHKAFATNKQPNLEPSRYDDFATYLATVLAGLRRKTGIALNYLSPVNEPQWDWSDGGQEGTPFTNAQIAGITKSLSRQLVDHKLHTQIVVPEAGKLDYLFAAADKPDRGNQLAAFWGDSTAATYLGAMPHVARIGAGHGYFTTSPYAQELKTRQQLATTARTISGLDYWQSEYCILGDNGGELNGNPRDLGIAPALYVARAIHADLAVGNATSWQWWLAVSPYNYKDGLVYIDKNKTDGSFYPSKMLWALGNYSRYLRPGAVRFSTSLDAPAAGALLVSAYRDAKGRRLVTIVVNTTDAPADLRLELARRRLGGGRTYVTSATADLQPGEPVAAGQVLHVAPRSITTLVSELR